jgi:hypothetical protein
LKPARRHYKLNDVVIKKVRFLAEYGAPLEHIGARQEGIEAVLQAIAEAGLAPDQERDLLLRITAKTGHNATII